MKSTLLFGLFAVIVFEPAITGLPQRPNEPVVAGFSPRSEASGEPNLSVGPDGRVYLSWLESIAGTKGHALKFSVRSKDGQWSPPSTITQGTNWFVNWADFPSILALSNGSLAAHWLANSGSADDEAYNIKLVLSRDGGKTWSKPITPHRDGTKTEHGFVSMIPSANGGVNAVWLDGRAGDGMVLVHTAIGLDGTLGKETVLDRRVCECCQTSAAPTPDGMVVVYRDRSDKEIRDISILRLKAGRWSEPQALSRDGWEINGCPINGPAVSTDGSNVAAAWFTAAQEKPRINVALSADAGEKFGPPFGVDDGNPIGRVDVIALPSRQALVSWIERTSKGAEIRARLVRPDGSKTRPIIISETSPARSSGFPRMKKSGDEVVFAWTDIAKGSKVRTAILNLKQIN